MTCFRLFLKQLFSPTLVFILFSAAPMAEAQVLFVSPSQAYAQAVQIEKEVNLLLEYHNISERSKPGAFKAVLLPRHVYEKAYVILTKIQILRQRNGFSRFTIISLEPKMSVDSELVYEQTQRILTEFRIIKARIGLTSQISPPQNYSGKKPIDVFNKLHQISLNIELLNQEPIVPNHVFAVVMKINEDVDVILQHLLIDDQTFPPAKNTDAKSADVLTAVFKAMAEIQRLQRQAGIVRTDFSTFQKNKGALPSDVFNMVGMVFAELQTIKANMEIKSIAAPATRFEGKTRADVQQLVRWISRKLQLIQQFR